MLCGCDMQPSPRKPGVAPLLHPSRQPSLQPSRQPSRQPLRQPSQQPSRQPLRQCRELLPQDRRTDCVFRAAPAIHPTRVVAALINPIRPRHQISAQATITPVRLRSGMTPDALNVQRAIAASLRTDQPLKNGLPPADFQALDKGLVRWPSQKTCTICIEPYKFGQKVIRLPCGHYFHGTCIEPWLHKSCRCPLCRKSALAKCITNPE